MLLPGSSAQLPTRHLHINMMFSSYCPPSSFVLVFRSVVVLVLILVLVVVVIVLVVVVAAAAAAAAKRSLRPCLSRLLSGIYTP